MVSMFKTNGVQVEIYDIPDMTEEEVARYIKLVESRKEAKIAKLRIEPVGLDEITLSFTCHGERFERIRRITGYLVGSIDRWNNAKQAEERDRVKHARS